MGKIGYLHLPIIYRRCFNEIRLENLTLLSDHVYMKFGHLEGTRTPKFHLERVMTVTSSSTRRFYWRRRRGSNSRAGFRPPSSLAGNPLHHLGTPPLSSFFRWGFQWGWRFRWDSNPCGISPTVLQTAPFSHFGYWTYLNWVEARESNSVI